MICFKPNGPGRRSQAVLPEEEEDRAYLSLFRPSLPSKIS